MFAWGSEELRWDVSTTYRRIDVSQPRSTPQLTYVTITSQIFNANWTEADWSYPPVIGEKGYIGSATSWNGTDDSTYYDPDRHSEDDIFSFPVYYKVRSVWDRYWWLGRFANGSQVQSGEYKYVTISPFLMEHPVLFFFFFFFANSFATVSVSRRLGLSATGSSPRTGISLSYPRLLLTWQNRQLIIPPLAARTHRELKSPQCRDTCEEVICFSLVSHHSFSDA